MPTRRKYEDFFYYEDGNLARCKRGGCSRPVVSRTQTTSLEKHLKKYHPEDYAKFMLLKKGSKPSDNDPKDDGTAVVAEEVAGTSKDPGITAVVDEVAQASRIFVDRAVSPMPLLPLRAVIESDDEAQASSPPKRRRRVILESDDETENEPPSPPVSRRDRVHPLLPPRQQRPRRPQQSGRRTRSLANVRGGPAALGNGEYLVERVDAMRREGERVFWWVKWVGWDDCYSGWEPHENLENARGAIDDYLYDLYGFFLPTVPWLLQMN